MIILDLDDTLIDHSSAEMYAAQLFGKEHASGIPDYDATGFVRFWHDVAEMNIESFLRGEIDFKEQRRRRIRTIFNSPKMVADRADELFSDYLSHYQESWRLFPEVTEFLEKHHPEGLSVLSDGSQEQQEAKLKKTGILKFFSFVVTAESIGLAKPNPKMFQYLCNLARVDVKKTYYIGDNLKKDAIGSCNAGLRGIWLNRNGKFVPDGIASISSLSEFKHNQ